MKQGMHNGNDGWLTHRLMSVVLFLCYPRIEWCVGLFIDKTVEDKGGRNAFGYIKIVYLFSVAKPRGLLSHVFSRPAPGAVDNVLGYSQQHTTELMFPIEAIALIAIYCPFLWLAQTLAIRTT
jgi:hypothetical protein